MTFPSARSRSVRVQLLAMTLVTLIVAACREPGDAKDGKGARRDAMTPDPGATVTISLIDSGHRIVGSYTVPTALPDGSYAVDVLIDDRVPQTVGIVVVDAKRTTGTPSHDAGTSGVDVSE